jgi:cation transport ATPase
MHNTERFYTIMSTQPENSSSGTQYSQQMQEQKVHPEADTKQPSSSQEQPQHRSKHKKSGRAQTLLQVIFVLLYAIVFATLATVSLFTQNYIFLPVIHTMAQGFVYALYYIVGSHLPKSVLKRFVEHMENENDDDDEQ